ncbi:MAG: hypothetical protein M1831_004378 [Alyxoria varia]|nr:MAG: hypothetical protein M1831_004378 [Alyxoria varia]
MKRRVISETKVLKPVRPSLDEDDWPQFLLNNAEVTNVDGQLVNLLFANDNFPLTVTGRLERLGSTDQHLLRARDLLPATVQIDDVQHFSYGQFDSGDLAFWAAGQAGWFEMRPSRQYKNLYRDMSEAISILYFLSDLHGGQKIRSLGRFKPETVLSKYANDSANRCADSNHARTLFLKHKDVLLELMYQEKEGIKWGHTSIKGYLEEEQGAYQDDPSDTDEHTNTPAKAHASDDEDRTAERLAGKGKSALRPKSKKYSNKGKKGQYDPGGHDQDDNDSDEHMPDSTLKRTSTDSLPEDPRPKKRGAHTYNTSAYLEITSPATPGTQQQQPLPLSSTLRPTRPTSSLKPAGHITATRTLQNRPKPTPSKTLPRTDTGQAPSTQILDIITSPLPSYEPNTPDGSTWLCVFDGCTHRVYDAADEQSKDLIKEHYRKHAVESQKQLDLVRREERPYLPVGHLVQRVRNLAAQKRATSGGGSGAGGGLSGLGGGSGPKIEEEETKSPFAPPGVGSQQRPGCTTISGGGLESRLISAPMRNSFGMAGASGARQRV